MTPRADPDDWMLIGRLRGPHGVRGELSVEPLTDFPTRFGKLEAVYLGDRHQRFGIASARTKDRIFLTLEGVDSRELARRLSNLEIWIPREQAMELPEGQYYADEIIGLDVYTEEGQTLGKVEALISTGANDVYVVREGTREVLIPAIADIVQKIDRDRNLILIKVIPGLLDA